MRNRNSRNRENEILWAVLVTVLTAGWIVLCPMIMRWYVNTARMAERSGIPERHPAAIVEDYVTDGFSHLFYEVRHAVRDVCDILRDFPYHVPGEDRPDIVYEYTYLPMTDTEYGS